jgi:ketol-acid reductoisomerase
MFQKKKLYRKSKHILCAIMSSENRAIYDAMWKNKAQPDMTQMTVYEECAHCMRLIILSPTATNTNSE